MNRIEELQQKRDVLWHQFSKLHREYVAMYIQIEDIEKHIAMKRAEWKPIDAQMIELDKLLEIEYKNEKQQS